jgi:hypothetical protein
MFCLRRALQGIRFGVGGTVQLLGQLQDVKLLRIGEAFVRSFAVMRIDRAPVVPDHLDPLRADLAPIDVAHHFMWAWASRQADRLRHAFQSLAENDQRLRAGTKQFSALGPHGNDFAGLRDGSQVPNHFAILPRCSSKRCGPFIPIYAGGKG